MRRIRSRSSGSRRAAIARPRGSCTTLAHASAGGRWVATGGGGYRWAHVVPRAWTLYFAEMAHAAGDLPDALPPSRGSSSRRARAGEPVPTTFSEPPLDAASRRRGRARRGRAARRHTVGLMARTKLVCTLGPASASPSLVQGLVRAGTSVFRLNFSHGTPEEHARMVRPGARGRGRDGQAARGARRSARPEGAVVDGGSGSVHVPAGAAVRAQTRGRGGRARRLHHVSGPVGRPPGGRPRPARRRSGRADRERDRWRRGPDPVRRRRNRSERPRRERPGRAPGPAAGDRSRPRRSLASARTRRRLRGAVLRPRAERRARTARRDGRPATSRSSRRSRPGRR